MADRASSRSDFPSALVQLVTDYHGALYRYAYRLTGCVQDAEDLTQQVFLIAQQKLDQVRDSQCVRGWLFAVLRNCFLKTRRQSIAQPVSNGDIDINTISEELPETSVDSSDLQAAINRLSDEFKIVVLMFYFEERSYREIADELAIPLGTVMSRLARAKGSLRRALWDPLVAENNPEKPMDGQRRYFPASATTHAVSGTRVV